MNLGFIGYGSIAASHARAIHGFTGVRVTGVMGRLRESAEQFAREHGIDRVTTDLDELLDDPALDAVIVCSPSDVHADQTERALRAGKHVLCEIPLSTSLGDVDRLIDLADRFDRRLMVCHTQRYAPPLVEARRRIARGELHPYSIVSRYAFHRRENVNWVGRRRSWTDNLLWHHGCHAVDAALWLLGASAVEVVAQVANPSGPLQIPMDLGIAMRTSLDQIVTVAMSYNTHVSLHDYVVIGEETTLVFADGALRDREQVVVPRDEHFDPIAEQDAEFVASIRERREPAVSARSVRPAMAALQIAQDSLDARRPR